MTSRESVSYVYVKDKSHNWVPALQFKALEGNRANVARPIFTDEASMLQCDRPGKQRYNDNEIVDLSAYPNNVLPLQNVDVNGKLSDYKDMVKLPYMHEAAILYNLKLRHQSEKPYTRTGDIVIAVNPYQWYDGLYTKEKQALYSSRLVWDKYNDTDPRDLLDPHVYEVSALSYKGLAFGGENQSILVSGESGAGKTETLKICLNHIAGIQTGSAYDTADPIVNRIVESNPLLEAFGNAKTVRNDNSSRFGKYLQLQFEGNDSRCKLAGSKCDVYLLEKNRVTMHDPNERNFHIFYQLLASDDSVKTLFWDKLEGKGPESFVYVGTPKVSKIEGISDRDRFEDTLKCLELVGISGAKLHTIMNAVCMVIQLGNLRFKQHGENSDASQIASTQELEDLADLMGISTMELSVSLTERTFSSSDATHKVPLSTDGAQEACDALAKEIYQKAFLWLVARINDATICATDSEHHKTIGLLDIFGFESFEANRFEQLCINYANEKLQQKFTDDVFRSVQNEYKAEGIPLKDIWYDDNSHVLDLIEGKTGLLRLLNEECIRPNGNDLEFVQKALKINRESRCLLVHMTDRLSFGIRHYAQDVMYDAERFVNRNLDTLPTDLQRCVEQSSNYIASSPRNDSSRQVARGPRRQESNIAAPTIWTKYRNQLNELMANLKATKSRYIRCIKPNTKKSPLSMEHEITVEQLRCAGVVAGITISRSAFPNRLDNSTVLARYTISNESRWASIPLESRANDCRRVLKELFENKNFFNEKGDTSSPFAVGKTKTYFRAGALEFLESMRNSDMDLQAMTIQRGVRQWLARRHETAVAVSTLHNQLEEKRIAEQIEREELQRRLEKDHRALSKQTAIAVLQRKVELLEKKIREEDESFEKSHDALRRQMKSVAEQNAALTLKIRQDYEDLVVKPSKELAGQKQRIENATGLINALKTKNNKLVKQYELIRAKHNDLASVNHSLSDSCGHLTADIQVTRPKTEKEDKSYEGLQDEISCEISKNKLLKDQVRQCQDAYMSVATDRLQLQREMAEVLSMIQGRCENISLTEELVLVAFTCENSAQSTMAELEPEVTEPDLTLSECSGSDTE